MPLPPSASGRKEIINELRHHILRGWKSLRKNECYRYRELLRYRADKDKNKKLYISMCATAIRSLIAPTTNPKRRKMDINEYKNTFDVLDKKIADGFSRFR